MSNQQTIIEKIVNNLKISALNEMQIETINTIRKNENVVLLAPTGSGKTLAFLLPLLEILNSEQSKVQVLILSPSRELALQIESVFKSMSSGYKVNCCYGGHDVAIEKNNLSQPPAVLIGTPGRIADHLNNKRIDTSSLKTIIFDEFDKCLEFGFSEDISTIISQLPNITKRVLTSATQAIEIPSFTGVSNPVTVNYITDNSPKNLKIRIVSTTENEKLKSLFQLLCKVGSSSSIIFCNQRDTVEEISNLLWDENLPNSIFHGGLDQDIRERTLLKFRHGSHRVLVTTDLASRGLDIPEIENVIHFNIPQTESIFTHRNGRTARMHAFGTAYLLITDRETIPPFLNQSPEYEKFPSKTILPNETEWVTIYISAGKKEKMSKGDIVGFLMQKGQLLKDELGLIDILDHSSYVAVKRSKMDDLLRRIENEPIKKRKVKLEVAR